MSLELLGFDFGSWGDVMKAGGALAEAGIKTYETQKAADEASAAEKKKLDVVKAADERAAIAMANSMTSEGLAVSAPAGKSKTAAIAKASTDKRALEAAILAQDRAAEDLPVAVVKARVDAANVALDAAVQKQVATPTSTYAQNLVKAWQKIITKAKYGEIVKRADAPITLYESWWTRPAVGPVPGWGVAVGGVGMLGVIGLIVKRFVWR